MLAHPVARSASCASRVRFGGGVLLTALVLGACGKCSTPGAGSDALSDAASRGRAACVPLMHFRAPCDECVTTRCCAEMNACFSAAACIDLNDCVRTCGENAERGESAAREGECPGECERGRPGEVAALFRAWDACIASHCAATCPL